MYSPDEPPHKDAERQKGQDCIGNAKTGSGKTIAFALPILQRLSSDPYGIFALVLTPTRYVYSAVVSFTMTLMLFLLENLPFKYRNSSPSSALL